MTGKRPAEGPSGPPYLVRLQHPQCVPVEFRCPASVSIIEAARLAGHGMAAACERGGCGACRALLIQGEIGYLAQVSSSKRLDPASGERLYELSCQATPHSDLVLQPFRPWRTIPLTPLSALVRAKIP